MRLLQASPPLGLQGGARRVKSQAAIVAQFCRFPVRGPIFISLDRRYAFERGQAKARRLLRKSQHLHWKHWNRWCLPLKLRYLIDLEEIGGAFVSEASGRGVPLPGELLLHTAWGRLEVSVGALSAECA